MFMIGVLAGMVCLLLATALVLALCRTWAPQTDEERKADNDAQLRVLLDQMRRGDAMVALLANARQAKI